jgi:hypothetical protein
MRKPCIRSPYSFIQAEISEQVEPWQENFQLLPGQ